MSEPLEPTSSSACPMSMNVQRLFDGELAEGQIRPTMDHAATCAICAELLQSFESLSTLLGGVKGPTLAWQQELTRRAPEIAKGYDLGFVRRLTGIAAVLAVGLSAIAFTIPESTQADDTSLYAAIDKLTESTAPAGNEFASSFLKELSGANQ